MTSDAPINLEPGTGIVPEQDLRPKIPEPLPVKLVAVEDVALPAVCGLECAMDEFYVKLLEFAREDWEGGPAYRADNFRVYFRLGEGLIQRQEYRPLRVEVRSLTELEHKLVERELEYTRQHGLTPGSECLVMMDPSGNWVEAMERREVR
jgi:hypothetical protein